MKRPAPRSFRKHPASPTLPYPENQLVALTHSLISRGVIDEAELSTISSGLS